MTVLVQEKGCGVLNHCPEHAAYLTLMLEQYLEFIFGEVSVFEGSDQPMFDFVILSIGIGQFADKVSFVVTLAP